MNKDLILREKLAIERTELANQTTLLAFLRTALYFFIAGVSIHNVLNIESNGVFEFGLLTMSAIVFLIGIYNYFRHKTRITHAKDNVGNIKDEYILYK